MEEFDQLQKIPNMMQWNDDESLFYQEWKFSETTNLRLPTVCYKKDEYISNYVMKEPAMPTSLVCLET